MKITLTPRPVIVGVIVVAALALILTSRFSGGGGDPAAAPASSSSGTSISIGGDPVAVDAGQPSTQPSTTATDAPGDDDGVASDPPGLVVPTTAPDVEEAAEAFAAAWLNTFNKKPEAWRAALLPRVTADLAEDLSYADPDKVPHGGKAAQAKVTVDGALHNADIPVAAAAGKPDTLGTLHLTLVDTDGTWLVSAIDWEDAQ